MDCYYPDQVPTNKERYQRLVGKLISLTHKRPDLSYTINVVSQFMHSLSEAHQGAVDRILRYLKYNRYIIFKTWAFRCGRLHRL